MPPRPLPIPVVSPRRRRPAPGPRLLAGLRERDPDALAEIHRDYGPAVLGFLRGVLRDPVAAEDVHQDVFLDVWRKGSSFDPERGSLVTWIMLIARSRALDELRRRVPEPRDPQAARDEPEDPRASTDALLGRWRLAALLARLPAQERRVLRMRFDEGLSQSEIAERLGMPLGTVKTRMATALARLRDEVEREDRPS